MPLMFGPRGGVGERVAALDFMVAIGTHTADDTMRTERHVGQAVVDERRAARIFNSCCDDPANIRQAGRDCRRDVREYRVPSQRAVPVALNRCWSSRHVPLRAVFPHECVGFSVGPVPVWASPPRIIHFTSLLGA
jgi:hypothetical protein